MKAIILIGGEGTRLRPVTINTLKCMVPIVNRPFIEYQIRLLKKHGIKDIILSVCHMPEKVKKALGSGKRYGVRIKYANEKSPLGTGGAIRNCGAMLDSTTVVMNGDILTDIDITAFINAHKKSGAYVTIALREVTDPSSFGLVETNTKGGIIKFIEKPSGNDIKPGWINAGMYIFEQAAIFGIPSGRVISIERETFPGLIAQGKKIQSYKGAYYWLDIGRVEKYMQANFDVCEGKFKAGVFKRVGTGSSIKGASVDTRSVIGNNVIIQKDADIESSVILDNSLIKSGSVIKNCIIGKNSVIKENCTVINTALGDGSELTEYSKLGV
jgi:mannose-1-phosphate guanylyltransferase